MKDSKMIEEYKVTAFDLKLALLQYFRFQRGWVCIDEFRGADIIVDTGEEFIEVEVKVDKWDLTEGERKKERKHNNYKINHQYKRLKPNKFMFCVPERLVDIAKEMVLEINKSYGVIAFNEERFLRVIFDNSFHQHWEYIRIAKSAIKLHTDYNQKIKNSISMRLASKIAALQQRTFEEEIEKQIIERKKNEQPKGYT